MHSSNDTYKLFEGAMTELIVIPHFKSYIASISATSWASAASLDPYREMSWYILTEQGCLPFAKFDAVPIDLMPIFKHIGITDFIEIANILTALLINEDMQDIFLAVESFVFNKLEPMLQERLPVEYLKWYHKNKGNYSTLIQTNIRRSNAMWKYPILAYYQT